MKYYLLEVRGYGTVNLVYVYAPSRKSILRNREKFFKVWYGGTQAEITDIIQVTRKQAGRARYVFEF